jgi:asparagine synthase (glutamine-hydrolysing)
MCGIAGFYNLKADKDGIHCQSIGQSMEKAIAHRGPDTAAVWHDPDMPLVLAHRRLSIIDLSDGGKQPMHSASGRYVLITNGEIYNFQSLQRELEKAGHSFKSRSDTEVMLAAFEHWGVSQAIQKFNGMFAFVLWDRKERQLHFVRDRFGKKPLYVGWAGNDLVFASELKSFHAHPDFSAGINPDALHIYMRYGYMHAPYSIFDNVWQVLPAGRLSLDLQALCPGENLAEKMEVYWSLKMAAEEGRSKIIEAPEEEIIDELHGKIENAVTERMISDVPLGAFLSGGIDSSAVVALMQKNSAKAVKTYSVGFENQEYDESQYAKKIAEHLGTDHHEFQVTGLQARDVIPILPDIYDEPFSDPSQIPTYLISKLARQHVTVVLTGDGGDEILGGYDRHTKIPALWQSVGRMPKPLRRAALGAIAALPAQLYGEKRGEKAKRAMSLMLLSGPDEIYDRLLSSWPREKDVVKHHGDIEIPLTQEEYWPLDLNFAESMIYGDQLSYRSNDLMVKTDRASMAVALEVRAPLMDYKLAEFCWRLPHDIKVKQGKGKWALRQILKQHVPESLYERPKQGFSVPLESWLRGSLKEWAEDLLSEDALNRHGLLNNALVRQEWSYFQQNQGFQEVPKHLWSVLMFQSWYERWIGN